MSLQKTYMLGVDIGTGGCKATLVDGNGRILGSAYREYVTFYPQPGWAEQDPDDWYDAFQQTLKQAMSQQSVQAKDIACICIDGPTHTMILLDKEDNILSPAILWTDRRTIPQVEWLRKNFGKDIFKITYQEPNINWTLPYLLWVKENKPEVWRKFNRLFITKDYVRYRVTGVWATDRADALGTLMYDAANQKWSEEICSEILGISFSKLPPVYPPTKVIGKITKRAAKETGLIEGTPVIVGSTDQAVEAFGNGAIKEGQGIIKLATAGNVAVVTEKPYPAPGIITYYHLHPKKWYMLSATTSCAISYRWFRDVLCEEEVTSAKEQGLSSYELMNTKATLAPVGSEGLIFHPDLQGGLQNPYLRASFIGITMRHRKEHFTRAVLEGVAFSLRDRLEVLQRLNIPIKDFRLIGGGAKSSLWGQIVRDVMGIRAFRTAADDSSFGAALLAGVGVGIFKNMEEAVKRCVKVVDVLTPNPENYEKYTKIFEVYQKTHKDLIESYKLLYKILKER